MKKITILAALAAATAFSSPSIADSTHCQPGSINCTIGDDNSTTTNVNPSTIVAPITNVSPVNTNAQQQGQLQGQAQGILNSGNSANNNRNDSSANVLASGNSSNDNRNTNVNGLIGSGNSKNVNDVNNTNRLSSSASTGEITNTNSASSDNNNVVSNAASGNNTAVNVEGDTYVNPRQHRIVSSAWAPGLTSGIGTCLGSASMGVSTGLFGVSGGSTTRDEVCTLINLSTAVNSIGYTQEACELLRQDKRVEEAFRLTGHRCDGRVSVGEGPKDVPSQVSVETIVPTPTHDRTPVATTKFVSNPVVQQTR